MSIIITLSDTMPSVEGFEDVALVRDHEQSKRVRFFDPLEDIILFEIKKTSSVEELRRLFLVNDQIPFTAGAFYEITKEVHVKTLLSRWDPFRKAQKEVSAVCLGTSFKKGDQEMVLSFECEPTDMYRTFFSTDETFHDGDVVPLFNKHSKRIKNQLTA